MILLDVAGLMLRHTLDYYRSPHRRSTLQHLNSWSAMSLNNIENFSSETKETAKHIRNDFFVNKQN